MKNEIEQIAQQNDMSIEFVTWFFNEKKVGCGNVWFMMMAAMWEGWKGRSIEMDKLAAENVALKESRNNLAEFIHEELDADYPLNMNLETPATDRIVAEAEARGVERAIAHLEKKFSNIGVQIMNLQWLADSLREGASE
ncbi:hypothetical protein [Klebsiella pneumoniae]|uniref:hypothetical protein n=1 Tax=Klebsiella pneumoniae TaxID=573 RepID=UPI000D590AAC|nr:hypothetical protein [Klebsiella pneumoniae]HDU4863374.1 hypothetical protein [Klebsiella pneumoniae subsp. pneumoniae]MDM6845383.1 hypothetical protein [Klebsiella pneumoniae]MDP1341580.1 hypothetical protein [Klebsiella pneumoniae]ULK16302.1 hypothetical protein HUZ67_19535 [Klebsiella pneumoniae]HCB4005047.1 hypothetical protein [Klebsiella pneumoniae]